MTSQSPPLDPDQLWKMDRDHFLHPWTHFDSFRSAGSTIIAEARGMLSHRRTRQPVPRRPRWHVVRQRRLRTQGDGQSHCRSGGTSFLC